MRQGQTGRSRKAAAAKANRIALAEAEAVEEAAKHDREVRARQEEHAQRRNQDQAVEEEAAKQASLLKALRVAIEQKSIQERTEGSKAEDAKAIVQVEECVPKCQNPPHFSRELH